jgi:hypothetical protein
MGEDAAGDAEELAGLTVKNCDLNSSRAGEASGAGDTGKAYIVIFLYR